MRVRWFFLAALLSCGPTVEPQLETVASSSKPIMGVATYGDCDPAIVPAFQEAHRRGRIVASSPAFEQCLRQTFEGIRFFRNPPIPLPVTINGQTFGPYQRCGSETPATFAAVLYAARNPKPLKLSCDPGNEGNWGYAGGQDAAHETFTFAKTGIDSAGSGTPNYPELAATFWHEVNHDYGWGHDGCGYAEGVDPQLVSAPWIVDRCMSQISEVSARTCGRNSCTPGMSVIRGLSDTSCECIQDPQGFRDFTLAGPGAAASTSQFASVSRIPGSMETFFIAPDGSVQDAYTYVPAPWSRFQLMPPGSAGLTGGIAALAREPETMEVFWVGPDGSINDAYWYPATGWNHFQLMPPGSAALSSPIAALSRIPGSMEIFWIKADGSVQDAYWYPHTGWQHFQLAPPGSAAVYGGIAAVSRIPTSMEVFWIGPNGSVQDAYWYEGAQWNRFELAPPGRAALTSKIAAVSRIPDSMEIFYVGPQGQVQDASWYASAGWNGFELAPPGSAALSGGLSVASRIPSSMELVWVGPRGEVEDAYWYEGGQWGRYQLSPAGSASPWSGIKLLSRVDDSLELWYARPDGSVNDSYWYAPWTY
jgi:hypothetical protein